MKRLIVGISGATGAIYGIRTLQLLRTLTDIEIHLVITPAARVTIVSESDFSTAERHVADIRN
jgi:4-hydroxy-3-polyprenylbenzoate decarboxylase